MKCTTAIKELTKAKLEQDKAFATELKFVTTISEEVFGEEEISLNRQQRRAIERNKKNFYEIVNVDELAEDIKMNGLNHNLVVRKLDNGKYELISGERRYTALTKLVEEGNKIFALVPCKVIEANDIDSEIKELLKKIIE